MKIDKDYQLAIIQNTMRCVRGSIDTVWGVLLGGYSENFVGRKELIAEVSDLLEKVKKLEQRVFDARGL